MSETPAWIEFLFKRIAAGPALHTSFLLNLTNQQIREAIDAEPAGREQLRQAALCNLSSSEPRTVAQALVFLGVVGSPSDLPHVESLLEHRSDLVRRAARTCQFELRQAGRG